MLPTKTAVALALASDVQELFDDVQTWQQSLGHFQRASLVGDYDMAIRVLAPYITRTITNQQKQCLQLIHELAKQDVLGLAMEGLVHIVQTSKNDKDKLTAATILNDLYGEKKVGTDIPLGDKLSINVG